MSRTPSVHAERIREIYADGQYRSLRQVGDLLGVAAERVRQLCVAHGITRPPYLSKRPSCAKCGKQLDFRATYAECLDCRRADMFVILTCSECGRQFPRQRYIQRRIEKCYPNRGRVVFCDNHCHGAYVGKRWGGKTFRGILSLTCANCGITFPRSVARQRERERRGSRRHFCTRPCAAEFRRNGSRQQRRAAERAVLEAAIGAYAPGVYVHTSTAIRLADAVEALLEAERDCAKGDGDDAPN